MSVAADIQSQAVMQKRLYCYPYDSQLQIKLAADADDMTPAAAMSILGVLSREQLLVGSGNQMHAMCHVQLRDTTCELGLACLSVSITQLRIVHG